MVGGNGGFVEGARGSGKEWRGKKLNRKKAKGGGKSHD